MLVFKIVIYVTLTLYFCHK